MSSLILNSVKPNNKVILRNSNNIYNKQILLIIISHTDLIHESPSLARTKTTNSPPGGSVTFQKHEPELVNKNMEREKKHQPHKTLSTPTRSREI